MNEMVDMKNLLELVNVTHVLVYVGGGIICIAMIISIISLVSTKQGLHNKAFLVATLGVAILGVSVSLNIFVKLSLSELGTSPSGGSYIQIRDWIIPFMAGMFWVYIWKNK